MNKKARYWTFVAYPDSLGDIDLYNYLSELGLCFAISPLHDKDMNPTGEPKKPHYHVLLEFPGPTTYKNVKENIVDPIGQPIPKIVMTVRGAYRYLCHLDNPEKAQYSIDDIRKSSNFELVLTKTELTTLKILILDDIDSQHITEYYDLLLYYRKTGDFDRLDIVSNNTMFFSTYLNSYRAKLKKNLTSSHN